MRTVFESGALHCWKSRLKKQAAPPLGASGCARTIVASNAAVRKAKQMARWTDISIHLFASSM
jgi:hypothetical protein